VPRARQTSCVHNVCMQQQRCYTRPADGATIWWPAGAWQPTILRAACLRSLLQPNNVLLSRVKGVFLLLVVASNLFRDQNFRQLRDR